MKLVDVVVLKIEKNDFLDKIYRIDKISNSNFIKKKIIL